MNEKLKNYLAGTIILALLVFAFASLYFVLSYAKNAQPASFRSFTVTGEGSITAIPDIVQFSLGVITQGDTNLAATQQSNTEKANAAIAFLKEQGVEQKDITTKNYSVEPRYQYYNCSRGDTLCPPPDIVGYTVSQTVQVKVRDFNIIGELLSGVIEKGANTVSQLSFTIDDSTQIQNEARGKAVDQAKDKAQALAKAGGFRVGRLLSIQEGTILSPRYDFAALEVQRAGVPAPSIEPGSQDVKISVTLTYEIK